eukprot:CAMPEP_0119363578 /NCGR_PEP_ID=MMETSP1334-20130426/10480_1 /TAXON_ID=127549 /ORGANISM="Calcidiscus leptoporus, Strain RCC1130" /LENGTH=86 /DNA_ID=CAMNT_0007379063 /DNA_START=406 /DNA_END=666 /DNA_ORIENTATION=-
MRIFGDPENYKSEYIHKLSTDFMCMVLLQAFRVFRSMAPRELRCAARRGAARREEQKWEDGRWCGWAQHEPMRRRRDDCAMIQTVH